MYLGLSRRIHAGLLNANIDGQIIYSSEIIDYKVDQEQTDLHGNAKIHYTNMDLDAGFINVDWQSKC
ncbi:MAG: hypothetical protein CM1200mP10_32430 [Candidatus Neomarinimicrobiota bacterium]|nr:MAG: hypothetical protein CM1200mP10_32430 [Candidatus Neomarinimicrobiota bacterium]